MNVSPRSSPPTAGSSTRRPLCGGWALLSEAELRRGLAAPTLLERNTIAAVAARSRRLALPVQAQGQRLVVVVGSSLRARDGSLADLRTLLLLGGPVALVLARASDAPHPQRRAVGERRRARLLAVLPAAAFERFTRADETRTTGGAGLGLSIVRGIARAHGGEAYADTAPGGGARVRLSIPDASVDVPTPKGRPVAAGSAGARREPG